MSEKQLNGGAAAKDKTEAPKPESQPAPVEKVVTGKLSAVTSAFIAVLIDGKRYYADDSPIIAKVRDLRGHVVVCNYITDKYGNNILNSMEELK